jgi:hypothetical protein
VGLGTALANTDFTVFHLETALADNVGQVRCQLCILFVSAVKGKAIPVTGAEGP